MNFKVNANSMVKVKLTDLGIAILKNQHDYLNKSIEERGGIGFGEFELKTDTDGYYHDQLWNLMNTFGHLMTLGHDVPFELDIIITEGKPINEQK